MKKSRSKAKKVLTPHDLLFKKSLENTDAARQFVQPYMPSDVLRLVDLSTLEVQHVTFIEEDLTTSASDVIFRVLTQQKEPAYLYFLLEHQRKPERFMPFRLLKYLVKLMDLHVQKHKTDTLPLVLPMVVYNGKAKYPYSMNLFDLFDESVRDKAKDTLMNTYPLLDLSGYNVDAIQSDAWIGSLLAALKYGASKKISPRLLVKKLRVSLTHLARDGHLLYIRYIIRYICEVQPLEVQGQLWEELEETLKPILGDDYMLSIATALRQEGVEQGMQQGILQGMQQGMQQGVEKVAKSLLSRGMSVEFVADSTGIPVDLVVKLQKETRH